MKILILSCGTGGGHNTAALAVQENLFNRGIQADFIEYLDIINSKVKERVNNLYIRSTKGQGRVFKTAYHLGELYQKTKLKSPVYQLNYLNRKKLYNYIVTNKYDFVVTTHLFAAQALTAVNKKHRVPFIAIATDYVCIPFWEECKPDYFIIPSEDLKDDFIKKGIPEEKLLPYGIPVRKAYTENKNICYELNLDKDKRYVLILTGSMGFGNVVQMVEQLVKNITNVNFIVACGRNDELLRNLQAEFEQDERVILLPFTTQIDKYMKQSEIILTKPGGLTSTEIAVLGKPFIHTMPIPGCENYNANYFSSRGMSIKCDSVPEIIDSVKKLLTDKKLQNEMVQNQAKFMKQNTCDKIAELIIKELEK